MPPRSSGGAGQQLTCVRFTPGRCGGGHHPRPFRVSHRVFEARKPRAAILDSEWVIGE